MVKAVSFRTILVTLVIVYGTILAFRLFTFSSGPDGCSFLDSRVDCVVLDILDPFHIEIAAILSLTMLALSSRNTNIWSLETINMETRKIMTSIHKIVASQEQIQERRTAYATQAVRNHLGSLLLCIGIANQILDGKTSGSAAQLDEAYTDAKMILSKIRHILRLSIDVLDPMLVQQLEAFATKMEQDELPSLRAARPLKYGEIKKDVASLSKLFDKYTIRVIK